MELITLQGPIYIRAQVFQNDLQVDEAQKISEGGSRKAPHKRM